MRPRSMLAPLFGLAVAALPACSEPATLTYDDEAAQNIELPDADDGRAPGSSGIRTASAVDEVTEAAAPAIPSVAASQGPGPDAAPMLIRTASALVDVDSLDPATAALRAAVAAEGGYIGNVRVLGGEAARRSATLEAKVPADRFDALLAALDALGSVESVNVQTQDVGEEVVDVQARLANAERLEARLLAILERPGADLEDVLAVEREIARVRETAERLEGRLRYLQSRVRLATLSVTLREPGPLLGSRPGERPIRDAFRQAGRNLVAVVAFLIAALGVILPLAVVFGGLALLALRLRSRFAGGR